MNLINEIKKDNIKSNLGWIPEDWEVKSILEVFNFLKTYSYSRSALLRGGNSDRIFNIHYGDIHSTFDYQILDIERNIQLIPIIINPKEKYQFLKDGDLILADASEDYEGIGSSVEISNLKTLKVTSGLHTFALRDKNNSTVDGYRTYILEHTKVKKELYRIATGISVLGISKGNFSKIKIPLPPLPEQKKIAEILSTWDKAIETTQALIEKLEVRKKGLMQQLLTGKKRLPGFSGEWEEVTMEELTTNFSNRNKSLVNASVYSVTNDRGFILQSDMFAHQVAGKDLKNYKIIRKNEFAYNPARINVGSIALFNNEIGIISSLYVCFSTKNNLLDSYLEFLLETHEFKFKIQRYGEGGVRIYLWYYLFKHIKINLPSLNEQVEISRVLINASK